MNMRRKLFATLNTLTLTLGLSVSLVSAQENAFENYEPVSEFVFINPELKASDLDVTTIPYYNYAELTKEEVIQSVEAYFGDTASYIEEENKAPHYSLTKAERTFTLQTFDNQYTKGDEIFFNLYRGEFGYPYSGLTNSLMHFYEWYEDDIPLSNAPLDFMSFEEAETEVAHVVSDIFNLEKVVLTTKSIDEVEMQQYIDFQNLNKLKESTDDFTDEALPAYFGKITPYLGEYPLLTSNGTGMTEFITHLQAVFALTEKGLVYLDFMPFTPIGDEGGFYPEVVAYEDVLESIKADLLARPLGDEKDPIRQYIQNISIVYMPLLQGDLGKAADAASETFDDYSGYFPVWQVSVVNESPIDTIAHYFFVNPLNGEIMY